MSSKLRLVSPDLLQMTPEASPVMETDWGKCALCQEDKNEKLVCPADSKKQDAGSGYITLAEDLGAFSRAECLPKTFSILWLNDGGGVEATLKHHKAKFHKSCRLQYSKSRLVRATKRKSIDTETSMASSEKKQCRELLPRQKNSQKETNLCIFCEKPASLSNPLHEAMTKMISERVKRCATKVLDERLLSKVSSGDLVASEAKYHAKCLVGLYNAAERMKSNEQGDDRTIESYHARAFAELVAFIDDTFADKEHRPVFKLSDLVGLYRDRLKQLGVTSPCVHSTRLKDRILVNFPELQAFRDKRDVLLVPNEEIGTNLRQACENDIENDAFILAQAARIVRREMMTTTNQFNGSFPANCQEADLPQSLQTLVAMLCDGANISEQSLSTPSQAQLSICQLIVFNSLGRRKKKTLTTRHNKSREPPLPVYLGLFLHSKTRKRELVDTLHELGLSVSYDRVLEISTDLGTNICKYYDNLNTVCPPQLKRGVFTTCAVDNINHQTSATTAKNSLNGTSISVFQHFNDSNCDEIEPVMMLDDSTGSTIMSTRKSLPRLPTSYTQVPPVTQSNLSCPVPSLDWPMMTKCPLIAPSMQLEYRWLQHVSVAVNAGTDDACNVSWSAFHASHNDTTSGSQLTKSSLLPLFPDAAATIAMMKHSLDILKKITELANPGQAPVVAVDQPLFAIAKKIQWKWPLLYGEEKVVILFGGLHIELAALKTLGDLLKCSGWTSALVQAGLASAGIADSFLSASHITRTRRAHQVTVCALFQCLQDAYQDYVIDLEAGLEAKSLEDWSDQQRSSIPMFRFWFTVLQLQLTVLIFVRAIRTGNFELYVQSLTKLVPWFFSLDHFHYSRWVSIHLRDMVTLSHRHPQVHEEFMKGRFTVKKSTHSFSRIATDQAHEHNNAFVKGDGGAVGLTESPAALQRWMVSGPEMARLINEFGASVNHSPSEVDTRHHEQRPGVQKTFLQDVKSMKASINEYGNPFLETGGDLLVLDTRDISEKAVIDALFDIEAIGVKQYETFVKERLVEQTKSMDDCIPKNMLRLFSTPKKRLKTKAQQMMAEIKSDRNLFSRLYVACQVRDGNLDEFFSHENQSCPPSLSDRGKLRLGKKSDIIHCLEDEVTTEFQHTCPPSDVAILDGPAIVNMLKPGSAKTFGDYACDVFLPYVKLQLDKAQRVDIIWDDYRPGSLKQQTRQKRGTGVRRRVAPQNMVPKNWGEFLRVAENKKELFAFLSREVVTISTEKQIVSTLLEDVLFRQSRSKEGLAPCSHEEADTRIMVHVADAAKEFNTITVRSVDSDVVVLAIYAYSQLANSLTALWVGFGTGKNYRLIPAHNIYSALGREKALALPMFHAFTGCDTVSSFASRGKRIAWETWNMLPEITDTFLSLMEQPRLLDVDSAMATLERFAVLMYDKTSTLSHVNEARVDLFARKGRDVLHIPPTQGCLVEHVKRAAYQAGHCWSRSLFPLADLPQPEGWGWTRTSGEAWEVLWSKLPEASKVCRELIHCGCSKGCRTNCKCKKAVLPCTALCKCAGSCN